MVTLPGEKKKCNTTESTIDVTKIVGDGGTKNSRTTKRTKITCDSPKTKDTHYCSRNSLDPRNFKGQKYVVTYWYDSNNGTSKANMEFNTLMDCKMFIARKKMDGVLSRYEIKRTLPFDMYIIAGASEIIEYIGDGEEIIVICDDTSQDVGLVMSHQ